MSRFITDDQLAEYRNISNSVIFPGLGLIGSFTMINLTEDTIKIAPANEGMPQYLKLEIRNAQDDASVFQNISIKTAELAKARGDSILPSWGHGNIIPPKSNIQVDASCAWEDIVQTGLIEIECRWLFDNNPAILKDTSIKAVRYEGDSKIFRILLSPETSVDSIYTLYIQARIKNIERKYQNVVSLCSQILEIDSTFYDAVLLITEALWRLGQYEEGLIHARKGVEVLQEFIDRMGGDFHGDGQYEIDKMQERISKMERKEAWSPVGYPRM
jgi:hypothetical protein